MKKRKTNRSKRHSSGCRNHGSCTWCRDNRLHQVHKEEEKLNNEIKEYFNGDKQKDD